MNFPKIIPILGNANIVVHALTSPVLLQEHINLSCVNDEMKLYYVFCLSKYKVELAHLQTTH
jgi:hypothetical protein